MVKKYYPELGGKQVYPNWRLDKNISWYNVTNFPAGILYGIFSLEFIRDWKMFVKRFHLGPVWLPYIYGDDYYIEEI